MAKPRKSFPLRLDPELYDVIRAWADQEMRSVNGQIEFILKQAASARGRKIADAESSDTVPRTSADG
ncbi:MAG: hypothetical protein O3A00_14105 [Planctomycetota bacterium]|nr:hypothetical protein [Planctomycetota bacterium]